MNKIVSGVFLGIVSLCLVFVFFNYFSIKNPATVSSFSDSASSKGSESVPAPQDEVKIEPAVQQVFQPVPQPVVQPVKEDPQIKIELCKSANDSLRSMRSAELDKQLNSFKTVMDEIALKSYQNCTSEGMSNIQPGMSPEAFSAYVSLVKTSCKNSFDEGQKKEEVIIANNRTSEYNKLEQGLQADYTACLEK